MNSILTFIIALTALASSPNIHTGSPEKKIVPVMQNLAQIVGLQTAERHAQAVAEARTVALRAYEVLQVSPLCSDQGRTATEQLEQRITGLSVEDLNGLLYLIEPVNEKGIDGICKEGAQKNIEDILVQEMIQRTREMSSKEKQRVGGYIQSWLKSNNGECGFFATLPVANLLEDCSWLSIQNNRLG